ncbi:TPA: ribulose 1,5-bisphosphate carboxylase [Candidatus Bathyarchaeota archaeon]|nr:ribulose 1,5-bisphosphate carboxylase [Candidatus Bathyarchaeota archaeon]
MDPDESVIATYYVEGRGIPPLEAGIKIAEEESIGTWTDVATLTEWARDHLAAKVFSVKDQRGNAGIVKIAFPIDLFDHRIGGIPNILSIVAGNLFGSGSLNNVRLLDAEFPKAMVKAFRGPKFGIEGVRRLVGTEGDRRPHLGTIIKPKVGLNPRQTADVAYNAAMGGVDFIKDDETLTSQWFNPLEHRVSCVMEALDRVREETGRRVLYAADITTEAHRVLDLADRALENGANCLMVDVITAGFSAVRALAEDPSVNVPIHVHRCMHAAMTRNPRHGISMLVIAKFVRLAGGDQLHTGTAVGKMGGIHKNVGEIQAINEFMRGDWHGLRPMFPVASGGMHPGIVHPNLRLLGSDIVIQAGGGIHGHPDGTVAGARAMTQAIDAFMKGIPLERYAEDHPELRRALDKWGYRFAEEAGSVRE